MLRYASTESTFWVCLKKMKLYASSAPETVVGIVASKNNDHSSMVTMIQEPVSLRRKKLPLCEEKQKILATKVVNPGIGFLNHMVQSVPVEPFISRVAFNMLIYILN